MDAQKVIAELSEMYPDKPVKLLPQENPTEIVCEFDSREAHADWSLAIAIIDQSAPHYHKVMVEIYRVVKGKLTLHVDDEQFEMYEGQEYTIVPGTKHWATGDETWVEVYCSPGYTPDDHYLL